MGVETGFGQGDHKFSCLLARVAVKRALTALIE